MLADVYVRRKFVDGEPVNRGGGRSRDAESCVEFTVYKVSGDRVGGGRVERDQSLKGFESAVTSSRVSRIRISSTVISRTRKVESTTRGEIKRAVRGKVQISLVVGTCRASARALVGEGDISDCGNK